MLNGFADSSVVRQTIEEASDALNLDLGALIANGPKASLDLTTNTQPVMLTAAVACYRAWIASGGLPPKMVAGHSLGEYSALVAANVIAFKDAVPLVRFRAQAMQDAVPVGIGGMAAILGLSDDVVCEICNDAAQDQIVEAVNFNAPAQVVIAGHKAAVERACEAAKARGAKRALLLPVSAPFHSSLLKPASEHLQRYLSGISLSTPAIPVVNNVDVAIEDDVAAIKDALVRQAASPVRWVETIRKIVDSGVDTIIECGPGKVLAGLSKRIEAGVLSEAIYDQSSLDKMLETLK